MVRAGRERTGTGREKRSLGEAASLALAARCLFTSAVRPVSWRQREPHHGNHCKVMACHSLASRSLNMQRQQKRGHNKGREYTPHNYFPPPKHQDNSLDGKLSAMASKIISNSFHNLQFLLKFNITVVVFWMGHNRPAVYVFYTMRNQ